MLIDTIILAAGRGARLGDLTVDRPKCLLELEPGVTLLDALIRNIRTLPDVRTISVIAGYHADRVAGHLAMHYGSGISLITVADYARLNNAHTLREALKSAPADVAILEVNGDVYCAPEIFTEATVSLTECASNEARIFVRADQCGDEEMKVLLKPDGSVESLHKGHEPQQCLGEAFGITYMGVDFARTLPDSLTHVIEQSPHSYFEDGLNEHFSRGYRALPHLIGDRFAMEVDFPEDLERARAAYRELHQ